VVGQNGESHSGQKGEYHTETVKGGEGRSEKRGMRVRAGLNFCHAEEGGGQKKGQEKTGGVETLTGIQAGQLGPGVSDKNCITVAWSFNRGEK